MWPGWGRFAELRYRRNVRQPENSSLPPGEQERQEDQYDQPHYKRGPDPNPKSPIWRIMNSFMCGVERDHRYSDKGHCSCIEIDTASRTI